MTRFRWTMLVEAAETWQGLWDPWTRSGFYFRDLDDSHRMELVLATLRSLYRDGLIRFFRYPARADQDPALVTSFLNTAEVDQLLTPGTHLVVDPSYPDHDDALGVWFEATTAGVEQIARLSERQVLQAPGSGDNPGPPVY